MDAVSRATRYHSQMLVEAFTDVDFTQHLRDAFVQNFHQCISGTGDILLGDHAANTLKRAICLGDHDHNPNSDAMVAASAQRLLDAIPSSNNIVWASNDYHDFVAAIREELSYLWRRRLEGVTKPGIVQPVL